MEYTVILEGRPKSTGTLYRYACRGKHPCMYMTSSGKALKEDYQWQAKSQWKRKIIENPLIISVRLYFEDNRKADWDNFHKVSMDALTGIVWNDDSQIMEATVSKYYDKARPRIEIDILEL